MADHEHGHESPQEHAHQAHAERTFKVGDHVEADFGDNLGNVKGFIVAHIAKAAYTVEGANGPETKYGIQAPDGSVHAMAYRETKPGDVTGLTFKKIA